MEYNNQSNQIYLKIKQRLIEVEGYFPSFNERMKYLDSIFYEDFGILVYSWKGDILMYFEITIQNQ